MKRILLIFSLLILLCRATFAAGFPAIEIYEKTSKSVVLILASHEGERDSLGAGSFIRPDLILTSAHIVIDKSISRPYKKIRVYLKPEKVTGTVSHDLIYHLEAEVIAFDQKLDLAVLKVEKAPPGINVIEMGDSNEIKTGEEVVAIGHPEQGGLWTLTYGRISGGIQDYAGITGKHVFQTDTSINRGNSGGPLLDKRGYMVGINSAAARLGEEDMPITGVNFAIQSSVVKKWLEKEGIKNSYGKIPIDEETPSVVRKQDESVLETPTINKEPHCIDMKPQLPEIELDEITKESEGVEKGDRKDGKNGVQMEKKDDIPSDKILTPKCPYKNEDVWTEAERDLENIMDDMRRRLQR